jgi:hypothetical protein
MSLNDAITGTGGRLPAQAPSSVLEATAISKNFVLMDSPQISGVVAARDNAVAANVASSENVMTAAIPGSAVSE